MKHIIFGVFIALFLLYGSQNWHQYSAVIMVTAWIKHRGNLTAKL